MGLGGPACWAVVKLRSTELETQSRGQAADVEKEIEQLDHEQRRGRFRWWEHDQCGDADSGDHRRLDGQSATTSAEQ